MSASLNPSIEANLIEAIQSTRRKESGPRETFYMSSLGFCPRKQIAERAGIPPSSPPDFRAQFKMWTGTHLGKGIQTLLESVGYLDPAWTEKRVTYKTYSGKVDGLTHAIEGDAIIEVKTCDDNAVTRYEMPDSYLWQAMGYCLATGIPKVVIFMLGKNQGLAKHRLFHLDAAWTEMLTKEMDKMERIWEMFVLHKLLPSHEHRFAFEDRYCPYLGETALEQAQSLKEDSHAD